MLHIKLGIIGCGNMGEALLKGILSRKILNRSDIYASDKIKTKAQNLKKRYGINPLSLNSALVRKSQIIILAVKPKDAVKVLEEIRYYADRDKLIISIMAGFRMEKIKNILSAPVPIARVMPNMAASIGQSVSAISYNKLVRDSQKAIVRTLFKGIGAIVEIDEKMQDAFTALCGSGPAYVFYIIEGLLKAAVNEGFTHGEALKLIAEVIKASVKVLEVSGTAPQVLRKKVTSKGGTTEAAIKIFEKRHLKKTIADAVKAAAKRSRVLSR